MEQQARSIAHPGERIGNYRNSTPRFIKLLGLGAGGGRVAQRVAARGLPNVDVAIDAMPAGWDRVAGEAPGSRANMIVIVCAAGDDALFKREHTRHGVLVTFVLLQPKTDLADGRERSAADLRSYSDLFVTTSDVDYVPDLIENLAS